VVNLVCNEPCDAPLEDGDVTLSVDVLMLDLEC